MRAKRTRRRCSPRKDEVTGTGKRYCKYRYIGTQSCSLTGILYLFRSRWFRWSHERLHQAVTLKAIPSKNIIFLAEHCQVYCRSGAPKTSSEPNDLFSTIDFLLFHKNSARLLLNWHWKLLSLWPEIESKNVYCPRKVAPTNYRTCRRGFQIKQDTNSKRHRPRSCSARPEQSSNT